ncbi:hypothetical protein QBC40DRAFT_215057 [Triangularia verruculosa]|uniref:Protein kinase domain-containing protein n=1 Tax=Triangularia verruculosa TaxID=2587418 RepID=A0AAN6XRE1_9PEZI|nr:hypothetical protein QBC40DRAFT_215057 [Triangularia verruculosa]
MNDDAYDLEALQNGSLASSNLTKFKLTPTPSLTVFPDEIFSLGPSLTHLDLSNTSLSSLPSRFSTHLPNLKILFLSNCAFSTFPDLSSCPNLEMVAFRHNNMTSLPENHLPPKLRWLILTDNAIPSLPTSIGNCPNLEKCLLAGNNLSTLPSSLTSCQNLTLLRLSANNFTTLPKFLFSAFPKLCYFSFGGNPCSVSSRAKHKLPFGLLDIPYPSLTIESTLGQGASGVISLASWQPSPDNSDYTEPVAVKMFKGHLTSDGRPEDELEAVLLAGSHESLIGVLGKVTEYHHGSDSKGGIVMQLIPDTYKVLGLPPDLETCTRDRFTDEHKGWEVGKAVEMLTGIASAAEHLHQKRISHGDLYAHNVLASREDGHGVLGDFGAGSIYGEEEDGVERLEVAAFGRLIGDVLGLVGDGEGEEGRTMKKGLEELRERCEGVVVEERPDFEEVVEQLRGMLGWRGMMRIPEVPN